MKKILIIATIFLLAAACAKTPPVVTIQPTPTPIPTITPSPTPAWNTYTSPSKYAFTIQYPSDFGFSTTYSQVQGLSYIPVCDTDMAACAYLPRVTYPGTNFDGAGVSVNIDPSLNTQAKCYSFNDPYSEVHGTSTPVTINGTIFYSAMGGGGAAGHFDKVQAYRNFHNNQCYEIAQHVAETDIGNYPSGVVTQFDENAVWQKLQGVVNTFQFGS